MKKTKTPRLNARAHIIGLGATAIGYGVLGPIGVLTFTDMKDTGRINSIPKKTNLIKGTETTIYFANEAAVTREIKRLQRLRKAMQAIHPAVEIVYVEEDKGPGSSGAI